MFEKLTADTALNLLQTTQAQSNPLKTNAHSADDIAKVAREFEAVFISEMVKPMFEGIKTDGPFGGGKGEEIFRGMMLNEYGKAIAEKDITGIQAQVRNKLIEMQAERSAQNHSTATQYGVVRDLDVAHETRPKTETNSGTHNNDMFNEGTR